MSRNKHLTEQEQRKNERIIEGFRNNRQQVIQSCYREVYPLIARLVANNGGNEADVRSTLHDGLLVFRKKCKNPDFKLTAKFSSYLYGICRLLWLQELGNRRKDVLKYLELRSNDEDSVENENKYYAVNQDIEDSIYAQQLTSLVHQFLEQSGQRCKEVVRLYALGKSHREIAQELQITETVSKKTLNRCRIRLAQSIKASTYFQELLADSTISAFLKKYLKHFVWLVLFV
ncbi:MAG: RNA polymerase sigma factor [Chitinophagales bacterium]